MSLLRAIAICSICVGASAWAQSSSVVQIPGLCVPPAPPLLDEGSLEILETTEGQELSRYMDEAQAYSLCLDATKQQLYAEVNNYLEQWRETHKD